MGMNTLLQCRRWLAGRPSRLWIERVMQVFYYEVLCPVVGPGRACEAGSACFQVESGAVWQFS